MSAATAAALAPDWLSALIAGGPLLLAWPAVWVHRRLSLRREQRQARRREALARHPAKRLLSPDERRRWQEITGAYYDHETAEESR